MTTKALRELEALRSVQVHTTTFLRVELPDRTALVGAFSPLVRSWEPPRAYASCGCRICF